jgi:phage tail P2-like protein
MSRDLAPSSWTELDRVLAELAKVFLFDDIPTDLSVLSDPDRCPPAFLPWLAWALSVDDWNAEWSLEQKRSVVRNSFLVHARKGTVGAIRRAVESVGYEITIVELQRTLGASYAYQFDADVNVGEQGIDGETQSEIERLIETNKRVSCHLRNLNLRAVNLELPIYMGATTVTGEMTTITLDTTD